MTAPEHLVPTVSHRGLRYMPAIRDIWGNAPVQVYESSTATEPQIWIQLGAANALLNASDAWRLADQIRWLVRHHYHGDATPADTP